LDPYSRLQFKQYVKKQREKGKTIILTTHILNEIEELADEIILIMEGKVYFQGSLVELKIVHDSHHLEEALAKITKKQVYEVKAS
jgi:Cu-processing system ATP-binding protein